MKSYDQHLKSIQQSGEKKKSIRKPTLRSSGLFPVIHNQDFSSSIHFLGYWLLKRKIPEVSLLITVRNNFGQIINRKVELIDSVKAYTIKLKSLLKEIDFDLNNNFLGSIETEFFSTRDMVFPFPALVLEYSNNQFSNNQFSTCVHTLGRAYNDFEDLIENEEETVPESGFDIYSNDELESFFAFVNGPIINKDGSVKYEITNEKSEKHSGIFNLGEIKPFETKFIFLKDQIPDLSKILGNTFGSISLKHNFKGFFPRFLVGNTQKSFPSMSFTHSYYDCTQCVGDGDFWNRQNEKYYDSSVYVPLFISNNSYTDLIVYPIFSPSDFSIKVDLFDTKGNKIYENDDYFKITQSDRNLKKISFNKIINDLKLDKQQNYSAHIITKHNDDKHIPSRIKFGLDVGVLNSLSKLPCNVCFNTRLSNINLFNKPGSFRWSPIFKNGKCVVTLGNFSPIIDYSQDANIVLNFFRKKDTSSISRKIFLGPNCEKRISINDDELKKFFDDDGWVTIQSDNPWILGYYFNFHDSGAVAGDHFF